MEGRAGHIASIGAAVRAVNELQDGIRMAKERYPEALNLTINATGEDPVTDAALAAMEAVVVLVLRIDDLSDLCEVAKRRLAQYSMTF